MKLTNLRVSNFQSFGPTSTTIQLDRVTYLIGPNGAGKTAVLQALARMFAFEPSLRRVRRSDFHVPAKQEGAQAAPSTSLWIEAEIEFPETLDSKTNATVPGYFAHMQLKSGGDVPVVRIRLTATLDADGEVEEKLCYVQEADANGEPQKASITPKSDRSKVQLYYLPARRDPSDHVSYTASALLGRLLRAAKWDAQEEQIQELSGKIDDALVNNAAVDAIDKEVAARWATLHFGKHFAQPCLSFKNNEIESLLRHLTLTFSPTQAGESVDFSLLSDGQKSLLYLTLVLAVQRVGREVLDGTQKAFDAELLRPPLYTILAIEEPENSLSPHLLGRIVNVLREFDSAMDGQAIVGTHAPSLLTRVPPEQVRYLRLGTNRCTVVRSITIPASSDESYKFIREAVQAFPEVYFARLVVLGEGDSEEIVLPRLLRATDMPADVMGISIAPLGGRHVNHFWRLLTDLDIPHLTLLDLDLGRHQGGWGRLKYAGTQLASFHPDKSKQIMEAVGKLPAWNDTAALFRSTPLAKEWTDALEGYGVFFSAPLDLDFAMLRAFSGAYGVEPGALQAPDESVVVAVLGKSHGPADQYTTEEKTYFARYHTRFKTHSKPAAHLTALAALTDAELAEAMPEVLKRLISRAKTVLAEHPE